MHRIFRERSMYVQSEIFRMFQKHSGIFQLTMRENKKQLFQTHCIYYKKTTYVQDIITVAITIYYCSTVLFTLHKLSIITSQIEYQTLVHNM